MWGSVDVCVLVCAPHNVLNIIVSFEHTTNMSTNKTHSITCIFTTRRAQHKIVCSSFQHILRVYVVRDLDFVATFHAHILTYTNTLTQCKKTHTHMYALTVVARVIFLRRSHWPLLSRARGVHIHNMYVHTYTMHACHSKSTASGHAHERGRAHTHLH